MAKAEQQALRLFNNKQDTDLAVFLQAQPVAAGAAHLSLKTLADAGMAKSYTALLQSDLATQHNEPSDDSPALALHQLVGSMTEKGMPFITEVIAAMHAAGLSLDSTNADKDTPLHLAARSGQLQLCQLLVQHGADALARNTKNRWTICRATNPVVMLVLKVPHLGRTRHAGHLADKPSLLQRSSHFWPR